MTIEKLRELLHAQPFEPFAIHVADGRSVSVRHPDFVSLDPRGRIAHVFRADGGSEFIDLMLVTSLALTDGRRRPPRRR